MGLSCWANFSQRFIYLGIMGGSLNNNKEGHFTVYMDLNTFAIESLLIHESMRHVAFSNKRKEIK